MPISGDDLLELVSTSNPDVEVLDGINEFKAFVKKEFVDINQVPKYIEAICTAVDSTTFSADIHTTSFSVLAHLVKRVSMQDHSGKVLQSQSFLALPVIIKRLGDSKSSVRTTAKRALEAYWFSSPQDVEMAIIDIALGTTNLTVIQESIAWIHHIFTDVSQMFKLDDFIPSLIRIIINVNDPNINTSIKSLFVDYYSLAANQPQVHKLMKELTNNRVPHRFCEDVMHEVESRNGMKNNSNFVSGETTRITVQRENHEDLKRQEPKPRRVSPTISTNARDSSHPQKQTTTTIAGIVDSDDEIKVQEVTDADLLKLTSSLTNYKFESKLQVVKPTRVVNSDAIYDILSNMTPSFEGKETEFNWAAREKSIILLRSILRGNASSEYRQELIIGIKEVADPICKAVMSLRTTLSTHGCQLLKECAMILTTDFDSLFEAFFPTLSKLCSATKHIASTNANTALVSMFMNCSFQTKLYSRIQHSSIEKNFQPRSYSGTWLQILIIRFAEHPQFLIEPCTKIITKLLGDQNPTVRQVAKDTFWIFWKHFPSYGEAMLPKLEGNIVRALERSRPKVSGASLPAPTSSTLGRKTSKPSIRETIMAKNREIREKEREQRLSSRPPSKTEAPSTIPFVSNDEERRLKTSTSSSSLKYGRTSAGPKRNFSHEPTSNPTSHTTSSYSKSRITSVGVVGEARRDKAGSTFDIQADPIIKFLSSNSSEMKQEGINLLKFAILGDEVLSTDINELLTQISVTNPNLLKPLFLGSKELLKKTFQYFQRTHDFIRVCCILQETVDLVYVESVMSFVPFDELYSAFTIILGYATKISSILNNSDLVMQMIKFKNTIFSASIQFLSISADKIPISDDNYSKLVAVLLEMVTILRSTDLYDGLINLLNKFSTINSEMFEVSLNETSISIRDEVRSTSRTLGNSIDLDGDRSTIQPPQSASTMTSYDLTKVIYQPNNTVSLSNMSPLKEPSDLTMLMPTFGSSNEYILETKTKDNVKTSLDAEPHFDTVVEDNIDIDDDDNISTKHHDAGDDMETDEPREEPHNVFVERSIDDTTRTRRSDLFAKFNRENSTELVEDFAQVQIGEDKRDDLKNEDESAAASKNGFSGDDNASAYNTSINQADTSAFENPIQSFIDKLDPLNKISNKKKNIKIYHDDSIKGSPQKQRDYNYSEMNWFNYSVAKFRAESKGHNEASGVNITDSSIEDFKTLCSRFSENELQNNGFLELLNFLQERNPSSAFNIFLDSQGLATLEDSIWKFFDHFEDTMDAKSVTNLLSGLIILKQILVNRSFLNLDKLWETLLQISEKRVVDEDAMTEKNLCTEMTIATDEIFDEMLVGSFSTQAILNVILTSLPTLDRSTNSRITFMLESLLKSLSINTISFALTNPIIHQIHSSLEKHLNNESVCIRRCVVSIYGKLLKASSTIDSNKVENAEEKNAMRGILQNLTVPQKKLIEYYSQI